MKDVHVFPIRSHDGLDSRVKKGTVNYRWAVSDMLFRVAIADFISPPKFECFVISTHIEFQHYATLRQYQSCCGSQRSAFVCRAYARCTALWLSGCLKFIKLMLASTSMPCCWIRCLKVLLKRSGAMWFTPQNHLSLTGQACAWLNWGSRWFCTKHWQGQSCKNPVFHFFHNPT